MKHILVDRNGFPLTIGCLVGTGFVIRSIVEPDETNRYGQVAVSPSGTDSPVSAFVQPESFGGRFVAKLSELEIYDLLDQVEKIKELQIYLNSSKFSEDPTVQVVDVLTRLGLR
jgi:hypothetical protein